MAGLVCNFVRSYFGYGMVAFLRPDDVKNRIQGGLHAASRKTDSLRLRGKVRTDEAVDVVRKRHLPTTKPFFLLSANDSSDKGAKIHSRRHSSGPTFVTTR